MRRQAPGKKVRDIACARDRISDLRTNGFRDLFGRVDGSRRRDRRDARELGDVVQGDSAAAAATSARRRNRAGHTADYGGWERYRETAMRRTER